MSSQHNTQSRYLNTRYSAKNLQKRRKSTKVQSLWRRFVVPAKSQIPKTTTQRWRVAERQMGRKRISISTDHLMDNDDFVTISLAVFGNGMEVDALVLQVANQGRLPTNHRSIDRFLADRRPIQVLQHKLLQQFASNFQDFR